VNVRELLERGHQALRDERAKSEQDKLGHPRVGSIGCVADGEVYGVCHRKAHARQVGIEEPISLSQDILFKAGEANEYTWERLLTAAGVKFLKHDEVPIKAKIEGVPLEVLGHPDIVLTDDDGNPVLGIELKGIFGYTTGVQVYFEKRPKNENLIQAAGYSYFKQIPYALAYTSASWIKLQFDAKKYGAKNILPFYRVFYMEWRDDVLWYRDETQDEWVKTIITPQGIEEYYRTLQDMKVHRDLGPRPTSNYVDGTPDKWGPQGQCGLCSYAPACAQYESDRDYDAWLASIAAVTE